LRHDIEKYVGWETYTSLYLLCLLLHDATALFQQFADYLDNLCMFAMI
jgi:hypothetical protein